MTQALSAPEPLERAPQPAPLLLHVQDLTVCRGEHVVLRDVSFRVHVGERIAILGRSGVGKSTLMHVLAGMVAPTSGTIRWAGAPSEQARQAVLFQHFRLVPQLSVLTNVASGRLGRHPWWRTLPGFAPADKALARHWLTAVGLQDKATRPARRLSGGEQQRVAVARALIQEPQLLLADEPVASLDAETANEVMGLFTSLNQQQKLTVISVLHDIEMAERFAPRALLLDEGRIAYDGTSHGLESIVGEKLRWKSLL